MTLPKPKAGRPRKHGNRLGSMDNCAAKLKEDSQTYSVFLYGQKREVQAYSQTVLYEKLKTRRRSACSAHFSPELPVSSVSLFVVSLGLM